MNRPSSVPTFSHAASNLSLATLVQTSGGLVGSVHDAGPASENRLCGLGNGLTPDGISLLASQNFTAHQLRTLLLPSPEESLLFLAYHYAATSDK